MRKTRKEDNNNIMEILCLAKWSNHDRQDHCSIPKITCRLPRERKLQELCKPMQIIRYDKHYSGNDFK